jgi:hypothetical protein
MGGFSNLIKLENLNLVILDYHINLWEYKLRMNKAERILKSELARKKRHMKRAIVEKRTQEEYRRLRKLRNQRKKHL